MSMQCELPTRMTRILLHEQYKTPHDMELAYLNERKAGYMGLSYNFVGGAVGSFALMMATTNQSDSYRHAVEQPAISELSFVSGFAAAFAGAGCIFKASEIDKKIKALKTNKNK